MHIRRALLSLTLIAVIFAAPAPPPNFFAGSFSVHVTFTGKETLRTIIRSDGPEQRQRVDGNDANGNPFVNLFLYKPAPGKQALIVTNPIACHTGVLVENPFLLNPYVNATYAGVTTMNGHIVNKWENVLFFSKYTTTTHYVDAFTAQVVRVVWHSSEGKYNIPLM
jgi:hypothetical protein